MHIIALFVHILRRLCNSSQKQAPMLLWHGRLDVDGRVVSFMSWSLCRLHGWLVGEIARFGAGGVALEDHVYQQCHIGNANGAVVVDVSRIQVIALDVAKDYVYHDCHVSDAHKTVVVDIAFDCCTGTVGHKGKQQ